MAFKMNSQAHCVVHLRKRVFDQIKGLGLKGFNDFTILADKINLDTKYDQRSLSQLGELLYITI